jgi:hypothetical protein
MISFKTWATLEFKTDDRGCHDFLADLKHDSEFPRVNNYKALESYLLDECGACEGVVDAGRKI